MQTSRSLARIGWLIIGLALGAAGLASGSLQQPTEGPEVLARGPLHEAFAAPVVYNPAPGAIVPKPPPSEQIEEQPPDQKPQGRDVEWIPGYWSWDDERADYLWISGIWRDIPPGRQWVPGYWGPAEGGFRWTSGFWSPLAANGRVSYLPTPPQSLEIGPNTPQPEPDYLWSPGSWTWYENRYLWRPGFWVQSQPDWVWVPPSYVPTPGGYVYVDGYWDHPVDRRGVIYAPLVFSPAYIAQPAYVYTPSIVLSIGGLTANLFIRPSCHAYYFGDYYGYASVGPRAAYVPWFAYQQQRIGYDPLYASMRANHCREPGWDRQVRTEYAYRVEHVESRPAPTFEGQRVQLDRRRARGEDVRGLEIAHASNRPTGHAEAAAQRFEPVRPEHRAELLTRQSSVREVQQDRARVEAQARPLANVRPEDHRPQHLDVARSPIASREARASEPPRTAPPAHPEGHQAFRPTFQPHPEPASAANRPEPRHEAHPAPPHNAPRPEAAPQHNEPRGGSREPHREPKPREAEHNRPGKAR